MLTINVILFSSGIWTSGIDGMTAHAELFFQMPDVHHEAQQVETPIRQPEKRTDAHVVDARAHGPVHAGQPPVVIRLLPGTVHPGVSFPVIGLLKELVCADTRVLEFPELLQGDDRSEELALTM